jgi:hypothetical protein
MDGIDDVHFQSYENIHQMISMNLQESDTVSTIIYETNDSYYI